MVFRLDHFGKKLGLILTFFLLGNLSSIGQVIVRDTTNGKSFEISFGSKIYYKLYSDSILGVEISEDYGIVQTTEDTLIIMKDGIEVAANDISFIEIENKKLIKWRGLMSPIFVAGLGFLSKGITMLVAEGTESKNEELVPFYMGVGGGITILSGIPFYIKNKSYDLSKGKYTIITP